MTSIGDYGAYANLSSDKVRLDIKIPHTYDAELVAINAVGCLAELIGNSGKKELSVIIQRTEEDIIVLIKEYIARLERKGYKLKLLGSGEVPL